MYTFPVSDDVKKQADTDMRSIKLQAIVPVTLGVSIRFESHGKMFVCKKSAANTWSLWTWSLGQDLPRPGHVTPPRVRFGSLDEIRSDINYVLNNGVLPPAARISS